MPLDLHVLGLSLAFILSQDQTLRCFYINFSVFSFFLNRLVTLDLFEYLSPRTRIVITRTAIPSVLFPLCFLLSFVLVYRNYFNVLFCFHPARPLPCFFPKASAKLQPFSELTNYLQLFLSHFFDIFAKYDDFQRFNNLLLNVKIYFIAFLPYFSSYFSKKTHP